MAKENKKAALSLEERLDAALVPDWEQPYKVPANWCWTHVKIVANVLNGFAFKSACYSDTGIRIIRIANVQDGYIEDNAPVYYPEGSKKEIEKYLLQDKDLLISLTGNVGRVALLSSDYLPAALNQRVGCIRTVESVINKKYLFYVLLSESFQKECIKNAKGSAQLNMSTEWLKEQIIPLPPLPEQQRIVDCIESLFAKLDEAKEKAQEVVDGCDARRAAILHKAFTGELTAEWRKQEGIAYTTWKHVTVKDVCTDVKVGIVIKPSQYYTDKEYGTAAFRSANVREFHVDDFDWVYLNEIGMRTNQRSVVHTGDVLVVRSGNPGTACVVDERYDGYNAIDILIAVPNQTIITPNYLCAFTNSPIGRNLVAENKRGIALVHFNVSGYSKLELPLPTIEEQEEITSSLFALLEKEQQAKETAEQAIARIGAMKKAILARAFRGELGTNDPTDESAVELLKDILGGDKTNKDKAKPAKKRVAVPTETDAKLDTAMERDIVKLFYKADTTDVPIRQIMSISSKKFELMDALRALEKKAILKKNDTGSYSLVKQE